MLVKELLLALKHHHDDDQGPALADLSPIKPILFTLHHLFPTLFLPALDILDRRLVTRIAFESDVVDEGEGEDELREPETTASEPPRIVYYVRSGAPPPSSTSGRASHHRDTNDVTCYEVRTTGWSCTCAVYSFVAFNHPQQRLSGSVTQRPTMEQSTESRNCNWGGMVRSRDGTDVPICKHLLACTLVEHWDVARSLIVDRVVSKEEMAGWAAGWGV